MGRRSDSCHAAGLMTCGFALLALAACGGDSRPAQGADAAQTPSGAVAGDSLGRAHAADSTSAARAADRTVPLAASRAAAADTTQRAAASARSGNDTASRKSPVRPSTTTTSGSEAGAPSPSASRKAAVGAGSKAPDAPASSSAAAGTGSSGQLHDQYHQAPRDTVSQVQYTGWKHFNLNCARCHGEDVTGTTIAPHLVESFKADGPINNKDEFLKVVHGGRVAKGMPNWTGLIDEPTLDAIYQYVKGRSDGKIHPGRPAVNPN